MILTSPRAFATADPVGPVRSIERGRRGTSPPRAISVRAAFTRTGAVVVRPWAIRMRFANPALGAVAGHHLGFLRPAGRVVLAVMRLVERSPQDRRFAVRALRVHALDARAWADGTPVVEGVRPWPARVRFAHPAAFANAGHGRLGQLDHYHSVAVFGGGALEVSQLADRTLERHFSVVHPPILGRRRAVIVVVQEERLDLGNADPDRSGAAFRGGVFQPSRERISGHCLGSDYRTQGFTATAAGAGERRRSNCLAKRLSVVVMNDVKVDVSGLLAMAGWAQSPTRCHETCREGKPSNDVLQIHRISVSARRPFRNQFVAVGLLPRHQHLAVPAAAGARR